MTRLCLGASLQGQEPLCPEEHSCSVPHDQIGFFPRGCSCEATCRIYGDCCRDSEHYDEAEQRRNVNEYTCVGEGMYMRDKCLHDWKDPEVEALCLKGNTVSDLKMGLPVTNTATNITYVNSYCAICNGEDPNLLKVWEVALYCGSLNEGIHYDPVFNDGKWEVIPLNSTDSSFISCGSEHLPHEDALQSRIFCEPTINTCNGDHLPWSPQYMQHVQSACQSYSAAVYVFAQRFRNEHCAACNGYEGNKTCVINKVQSYIPLSMILDFSDRTGSALVGLTSQCGAGEAWDRLFKKCRKVFCPKQGEKFRGRCIST